MLSTNSVLSLDQGKLFPKAKNADEYYARFSGKEPAAPEAAFKPRRWYFLEFDVREMWANMGK